MKMIRVRFDNSFFTLPEFLFEDVETWVHEFTEDCLIDTIEEALDFIPYSRSLKTSIGGVLVYATIRHIMVSLHMKSMIEDRLVNPDEFYEFIQSSGGGVK